MTTIRIVPHQTGTRFTFAVKRFWGGNRLGWSVVRVEGKFWTLPPGILTHLTIEDILRFATHADRRQRTSFDGVAVCEFMGKTRDATKTGIYWTGQKSFQVGMCRVRCNTVPFHGVYNGQLFTGIYVSFPDMPEKDYYLATDKDVSLSTFYKYLLFYKQNIGVHFVQGEWENYKHLPYGRDRRLDKCSMVNFESTPTQLTLEI